MKINDNLAALQAYTNITKSNRKINSSVARLSSGYKINSVSDDAAGTAISNKLRNQIRGMDMASRNSMDAISLVQTAEGALQEVHNMLQRIRELSLQASNETLEAEDRRKAQIEVEELFKEINDTAYKTEFNTVKILKGEAASESFEDGCEFKGLKVQIGANKGMEMTIDIPDVTKGLSLVAKGDPLDQCVLQTALDDYNTAEAEYKTSEQAVYSAECLVESIESALYDGDPSIPVDSLEKTVTYTYNDMLSAIGDANLSKWSSAAWDSLPVWSSDAPPERLDKFIISRDTDIADLESFILNIDSIGDAQISIGGAADIDGVIANIENELNTNLTLSITDQIAFEYARDWVVAAKDWITAKETADTAQANYDSALSDLKTAKESLETAKGDLTDKETEFYKLKQEQSVKDALAYSADGVIVSALDYQNYTDTMDAPAIERINIETLDGAQEAISFCDKAISFISEIRGKLGGIQNRLEHTSANLNITSENSQAALSRVLDTDMALEMTKYTQASIVSQAGMAILGQANQRPQQILQLLG